MRRPLFLVSVIQAGIGFLFLELGIYRTIALLIFISLVSVIFLSISNTDIQKLYSENYSQIFKISAALTVAVVLLCNGYFVMKNNIKCAEKFVSNSNGEEVEIECIVLYSDRTDENKLKVEAYPMLGKNYSGRVLLNSYSSKETAGEMKIPLPGEHILVRGKFQIPKPATNPRCFHYRNYLMGKRVFMTGLCGNFKVIGSEGGLIWDLKRYTEKIRKEFFKDNLSHDPAIGGLIRGVVLGDKSNLDEETYDRFRLYGTAHILAVSGLHIGILVTIYRRAYRAHPSMF